MSPLLNKLFLSLFIWSNSKDLSYICLRVGRPSIQYIQENEDKRLSFMIMSTKFVFSKSSDPGSAFVI